MGRLILVSNRLPVTVRRGRDGVPALIRSSGGMVAALGPVHEAGDGIWLGNIGDRLDPDVEATLEENRYVRVPVSSSENSAYYLGYSNSAVWPLFHYLPERVRFSRSQFATYKEVNQRFADRIVAIAEPGDTIWVHDYHLLLLPAMVREQLPSARIGFFLHIPFPSSEMFRLLPEREEVLRGLLGADVIGFHTYDYARHFISTVLRVLGIHMREGTAEVDGRRSVVATQPIGVGVGSWDEMARSSRTERRMQNLRRSFGDKKIILGVERMDYTKGIPLRLQAFRTLLETHPELQHKVVFVQIAASSRGEIPSYDEQKREIEQIVGQINGDFGSPGSVPIHYQHRSSPANDLAALYRMADVGLVTPLRDGMNLAAKEYVASQVDGNGVLVLSEFAGAASELGEALRVNPWDVEGTAEIIYQALNMESTEKSWRMYRMSERIRSNDVHRWARLAMSAIDRPSDSLTAEQTREVPGELAGALAPLLEGAINPVLVLDYDGTIREFTERPEHATPTDSVLRLLGDLEQLNGCTVVLSSGRDVWTMTEWFGHLNIILMAEHGAWIRMHQTDEWHASPTLGDGDWKRLVLPMLTDYVSRTPGSIVEEKTAALVWHYRAAESDLGTWQARELTSQLEEMLSREQVEVLEGARNVEMRQQGIDKGTAYQEISSILGPFDFCIALGDDRTDEDLFQALPRDAQTISVGDALLSARYRLSGPSEARSFLRTLLADE